MGQAVKQGRQAGTAGGRAAASSRLGRLAALLEHPRATLWACLMVPLAAGLVALALGQDANWDLRNYHWYNAFALFEGKLAIDLAPAGLQTYFNPLIDLPYYWANRHFPAPVAGFAFGVLNGLDFVVLLAVARAVLTGLPAQRRNRVALLLALAGVLTPQFLSELGTTMGDDTTALAVLGALALVATRWPRLKADAERGSLAGSPAAAAILLVAGVLSGAATGLKLTNAVYSVALCATFLIVPVHPVARLRFAFLFGLGVLAGIALTSGWWFLTLWRQFGNPLYPQFSSLFPSALTADVGVVDNLWRPNGTMERLMWPFITTLDPRRIGQITVHQIVWAALYVLFVWWAASSVFRRLRPAPGASAAPVRVEPARPAIGLDGREVLVLGFIGIGYVVWMLVFSIGRYLVPIELLAPLAVFLLLRRVLPPARADRVAAWVLAFNALVVLGGGVTGWGHAGWAREAIRADLPALAEPERTTVLIAGREEPYGFLAAELPRQVAAIGLATAFPASPAYFERARAIADERGGPVFAVVAASRDGRAEDMARYQSLFAASGLADSAVACGLVEKLKGFGVRVDVVSRPGGGCALALPAALARDLAAEDRALAALGASFTAAAGFPFDPTACTRRVAHVGTRAVPFQWCRVR